MSLFICAKCGCVDNTAASSYWSLMNIRYDGDLQKYAGKPLCSECGLLKFDKHDNPIVFRDIGTENFLKLRLLKNKLLNAIKKQI